jgi:hypothetical protein
MKKLILLFVLLSQSILYAQNYTLSSLTVNGLNDNWCGDIEEINFFGCSGSPDVFVEIYDYSNTLIYESSPTDNTASLELTLNIDLTNAPYTINVFDYDVVSSNDNLGVFTINSGDSGTLLLTNSGSTITVNVIESFEGCTDPNAENYDALATTNDGSCTYNSVCLDSEDLIVIDVLSDNWGYETSIELIGSNGINYLYVSEFTNNTLNTFNACVPNNATYVFTITDTYGDGICCINGDGYYTISICGETIVNGGSFQLEESINIEACSFDGADTDGCTDASAINYNPLATINDDSCVFFDCPDDFVPTDDNVFYAPEGSIVTETSIQLPTATENEMYSEYIQFYAPSVLAFDGTVITFNSATINSIDNLPNGLAHQCSPGSCTFIAEQNGCLGILGTPTQTGIFDLSITASVSVTYDGGFLGDIAIDFDIPYYGGNTYLDLAGIDAATINSFIPNFSIVVQESTTVPGCTDPIANNYNPLANVDDTTCDYEIICEGITAFIEMQTSAFASEITWELLNSNSDTIFTSSQSYNDNTTYTNETCLNLNETYFVDMHDEFGDGWLGSVLEISMLCDENPFLLLSTSLNTDFNQTESFYTSCSLVYGCTNEQATNYNELANVDDGSCIIPVYGCTDSEAVNFNPLAEIDDSSCNFFECSDEGISTEAGFYPPSGSSYNDDSSYVYLPDASIGEFYEEYLKFFAEDTMVLEGLEIGFISAKILNIINMPEGLYYQTSSADSTFYPNNVGCVGLFGNAEELGVYELSIEAEVTVLILGSPITFQLPYTGGVMILDLVYSDGDYTSLNSFIPTFVIEVKEGGIIDDILGCTNESAENYNSYATINDTSCYWSQTISLTNGWNLMSTYIQPLESDIMEIFSSIVDDVVIVKNNAGLAYLPDWQFNGIGDLIYSNGYQVKVGQSSNLPINGTVLAPELNPIILDAGWNIIAYLRQSSSDVILVLQTITDVNNLIIAKDNNGNAYLPEWGFNGIGNFESGKAYQVKVNETQELLYLSNGLEY